MLALQVHQLALRARGAWFSLFFPLKHKLLRPRPLPLWASLQTYE